MSVPSASIMEVDENNTRERDAEINNLMAIVDIILDELGTIKSTEIKQELATFIFDLDTSDEIAGLLMTVFTCLRKQERDLKGHERFLAYVATVAGIEVSVKSVVDKIKEKKIVINFLICTPIVEILTLFRSFFDEVRTGVTRFRVRDSVARRGIKRGNDGVARVVTKQLESTQNISQYGLTNQHIALLQGITLAPERRTGVLRSLGPLTQAILMVMEDKYYDKLKSALSNSLQMLPMATEIISALREAMYPGSVAGVLKELGDILLLTTARSTQKAYYPLMLFLSMWTQRGAVQWSFSGASALKFYTDFCITRKVAFKIRSGADPLKTSEVVFHATFGTYLENLNILEEITTKQKWHTRKELNAVFVKRGEKPKVDFPPITFKMVSKMAQALLTKSLGNIDPMSIGRPSFTGFRRRNFTQEFLSYITTGKSSHNFTSDPGQLQFALKKLKDEIMSEKDKLMRGGTSKWEKSDNRLR